MSDDADVLARRRAWRRSSAPPGRCGRARSRPRPAAASSPSVRLHVAPSMPGLLARTSPPAARAPGRARSRRAPWAAARRRAGGRPAASATISARSSVVGLAAASFVAAPPRPLQAEQDRGQRLARLVVELAGEPRAARAPGPRRPAGARRAATRSARSTATAARAAKVSASRRSSSVKRGSAAALVVRGDHADRAGRATSQRHEQAGAQPEAAGDLLVDLGVVERRVDALAAPPLEHAAALRARPAARYVPRSSSALRPRGGLDAEVARRRRQRDQRRASASISSRSRVGDQLEQRAELGLAGERVPDLGQRLELREPARRRLVQPRVLDRDRRLGGEQRARAPRPRR